MIARMWRGWASRENAAAYEQHFRSEVLRELSRVPGYRRAELLRREDGVETEIVVVTRFESMDAIRTFAGADPEAAVVAPRAREVLSRFEDRVRHYEVVALPDDA
jgi:heme-degrading monooxygenase HmoA